MSRNLRRKPRISYQELEEPDYDEYVFCDQCGFEVYEYCSVHGPLLVLPDDKMRGWECLLRSRCRRGCVSDRTAVKRSLSLHLNIAGSNHRRPLHVVDAGDPQRSNWMRYVNCSRFWAEQNLVAYQYQGELYYRTVKIIPRMTELLVFYGAEFARALRIDLRLYDKITAITVSPPKNNQASKTNAGSEKGEVVEPVACNIDLPSTSADKKRENSNKTVKKQTKDQNYEFTPKRDSTLEVTENIQLNNNESPKTVMNDASFLKTMDYSCTICKFRTNNEKNLNSHLKAHSAARQFTCDLCCYTTTVKLILIRHMRTHTGDKPYGCCEICDKKLTKGCLNRHMQLHTGIKPHECKICSKKFSERGNLKVHMRTHTGAKPYSCKVCNQKFSQSQSLNSHMRTHTGEKPYSCEVCNQKFSHRNSLNSHMRTHTGEKPYSCEVCNQNFSLKVTLKRHTRTHTGEKPYACEICNVKYTNKINLNKHILRIHRSENL